ncbi:MAG: dephospho-CoA kinase, partial [Chloroflexota bacterium]
IQAAFTVADYPKTQKERRPVKRPLVIWLTGNIGCGKSIVARTLAELGADVIDADQVAHQVMAPPGPVYDAIVREFGASVVAPDGSLDRRALGRIVFADPAALRLLDSLVHPETTVAIEQSVADTTAEVVVVEAIKLIESGLARICDSVWLVTCSRGQQIARLTTGRGLSVDDAERRIDAQAPASEKLPFATVVIDNSGTIDQTRRRVFEAWRGLGR